MFNQMSLRRPYFTRLHFTFVAFAFTASGGIPTRGASEWVYTQPNYALSPSREFLLFINPHTRDGHGSATYRLERNGQLIWTGDKPYALREPVVTDGGHIAGYAYRNGPKAPEPADGIYRSAGSMNPPSYLHMIVLDANGFELLNNVRERMEPPHHESSRPYMKEFFVDGDNDRMVARVAARGDEWWSYRLSDGSEIARTNVKGPTDKPGTLHFMLSAKLVKGTPLLITHWVRHDWKYKNERADGLFVLLDEKFDPLWTFEAPNDYAAKDLFGHAFSGGGPDSFFRRRPAIITDDAPGRFDVRLLAENRYVAFAVSPDAEERWGVRQLGRIEVPPIPSEPASGADKLDGPLPYLGEVLLGATPTPDAIIHDVVDFTFDRQGMIYFWRQQKDKPPILVAVDQSGALLRERPLTGVAYRGALRWTDTPRVRDDRFLTVRQTGEPTEHKGQYVLVSLESGEETLLKWYDGPYLMGITRTPDGRIVMHDGMTLKCVDRDGAVQWSKSVGDQEGQSFVSNLQVLTDGSIAVLAFDRVLLYSPEGEKRQVVELWEGFGKGEPRASLGYIAEIVADAEGGFVVANSANPPLVVRYGAGGKFLSRWSPHHPDGRTFDILPGVRVAPDGRLWTSDGQSFMRLTDDGVVDLVLGAPPQPGRLGKIIAFTTDLEGRLYAASHGTGVVHVFDRNGQALRTCKPDPTDLAGTVTETFIAVSELGEVYLKAPPRQDFMPPDTYLKFSSTGERIGVVTFEPSIPVGDFLSSGWFSQPGTGYRCGISGIRDEEGLLISDPPNKVVRLVKRRPNNRWIGPWNDLAMAPDGSFAVLDKNLWDDPNVYELDLLSANGDPLSTIRLPAPRKRYGGVACDGRVAVVAGDDEVLVLDIAAKGLRRYSVGGMPGSQRGWWPHLLPGGQELLLFNRTDGTVHRFQLPQPSARRTPTQDAEPLAPPDPSEAEVRNDWVREYLRRVEGLGPGEPCVLYDQKVDRGSRTLRQEQVDKLPPEERAGLEPMDMSGCGIRFDHPRLYARLLDLVAMHGLTEVEGARLLDFGCCDFRNLRALARMGATTKEVEVGFNLLAMCNDWTDVGELIGPDGKQGHLEIVRTGRLSPDDSAAILGEGYRLVTFRNVLHQGPSDDYYSSEPWRNAGLAWQADEFVRKLFALLDPGGWVLVHNVATDQTPVENPFPRSLWESAGFVVFEFDRDDRGAAFGIGLGLGWEKQSSPLDRTIRAKYTLLRKPGE